MTAARTVNRPSYPGRLRRALTRPLAGRGLAMKAPTGSHPWASARSSRTTAVAPRRMASGCACGPGPGAPSSPRGGARAGPGSAS